MTIVEEIIAHGHPNILGTHKTTLEITKENFLTKRGDCICGIAANKGIYDLSREFKEKAKSNVEITCLLKVNNVEEEITGFGHESLLFSHPTDIVIRKSGHVCPRTLMIHANKSAAELDRKLIELLKNPKTKIMMKLIIKD